MNTAIPSPPHVPVIGVIGGIGSGKSAVTRWVAEHANVLRIDADQMGHVALRMENVKQSLRRRFGNDILDESGEIRRGVLAQRVFGDSEDQKTARRDLEQIVHPAIEQQIVDAIAEGVKQGCEGVLLDAAVLLEAGWRRRCDAVVFVDAPDDVRERRVAARNGWSLAELQRREASQLALADKRQQSDIVISNEADDDRGGQELLDFLLRNWGICCKPLSNSSQQS
ncbi:MAG: dephospho-CoA kinase [Planctomycetota bacterium]